MNKKQRQESVDTLSDMLIGNCFQTLINFENGHKYIAKINGKWSSIEPYETNKKFNDASILEKEYELVTQLTKKLKVSKVISTKRL